MKKLAFLFIFLIILSAYALADDDEIYYSTYLVLDSGLSANLEIEKEPGSVIDYINAELFFYPKADSRQTIIDISTEPKATETADSFVFRWTGVQETLLRYKVESRVQVENRFEKVYNKINFPITEEIPEDILPYIEATEKIDSDDKNIIQFANEIAEGEDDLFVLIHKMAKWVKENIQYSLTTTTAEVTQKASWVLEERYGVCDELTALFMAMSRSLGIPARFISGIAYTNSPDFEEKWGGHGWAEIYLPGYGWVPFDVTYGELGWIDPSHIKLSESIDPDKPSGSLEWRGKNFNVKSSQIALSAEIIESGGKILDTVSIASKVYKKNVKFGSYNLVEAQIKNLRNYYVTTDISMSLPPEIEMGKHQNQQILLKPGEEKSIFWIVKVDETLNKEFVYTFPVLAYNQRNTQDTTEFKAANDEAYYSKQDMEAILNLRQEEDKKEYSREVELDCSPEKQEFYTYEENNIICLVKNKGNTILNDIKVCLDSDCQEIDLPITKGKSLNFEIKNKNPGERDMILKATNADVAKSVMLQVNVLDKPNISITEIEYPEEVHYTDIKKIEFTLKKESVSPPSNIQVNIDSKRIEHSWTAQEIDMTKKYVLQFNAWDLAEGDNEVILNVEYEDKNSNKYATEEKITINLANLNFWQKMKSKMKGFSFWLSSLF